MTKMKEGWDNLPRQSKLAALMWPSLVPETVKAEMRTIPYGAQEADPLMARAGRVVVRDYSKVPGLRKVQQRSK
jgi:hypothetical protein